MVGFLAHEDIGGVVHELVCIAQFFSSLNLNWLFKVKTNRLWKIFFEISYLNYEDWNFWRLKKKLLNSCRNCKQLKLLCSYKTICWKCREGFKMWNSIFQTIMLFFIQYVCCYLQFNLQFLAVHIQVFLCHWYDFVVNKISRFSITASKICGKVMYAALSIWYSYIWTALE